MARDTCQKKSARELRQRGSDYRCCIPALAGFVSPQSIAPDGDELFAKDRRRAIGFCSTVNLPPVGRDSVEPNVGAAFVPRRGNKSRDAKVPPTLLLHRQRAPRFDVPRRLRRASSYQIRNQSAQANGMFDLIRYVSVLSTSADLAMWRLRLPLFEESRCRRDAC
jgi:hypothetical protein